MNDLPFEWEEGEIVEQAYVTINGQKYYVTPARYDHGTSLSAYHLNRSEYETIKRLNGEILWTNPNPNISFSSQEITLSSGDYDVLEIYYYDWVDIDSYKDLLCQKTIKGHSTKLQVQLTNNNTAYAGNRRIRYIDDTTLQIDNGYKVIDNSHIDTGEANYWNVPVYVIGYKTGLFGGQS